MTSVTWSACLEVDWFSAAGRQERQRECGGTSECAQHLSILVHKRDRHCSGTSDAPRALELPTLDLLQHFFAGELVGEERRQSLPLTRSTIVDASSTWPGVSGPSLSRRRDGEPLVRADAQLRTVPSIASTSAFFTASV